MSQASVILPTSGVVSGLTFANDANAAFDAVRTLWSGATAPTADAAEEGQRWLDTSVANVMTYRIYDGSTWVAIFSVNTTTHVVEEVYPQRTAVVDVSYAATIYDRYIAFTTLTASRSVTLPASGTFPAGIELVICDESGSCNTARTITVAPQSGDSIKTAPGLSANLSLPYSFVRLRYNGTNQWTLVGAVPASVLPGVGAI